MTERDLLGTAKRIVVKVGSSTLTSAGGALDPEPFAALAGQIAAARAAGHQVVLVSSGAVAAGRAVLGLERAPRTMPLKQACAAAGQREVMDRWEQAFRKHGAFTAQVLLTRDVASDRPRLVNARNTLETLLRLDAIPVVNENDTVAVEEIRFGDNDELSALVVNLIGARLLVLLTDTDGLYTADPRRDRGAQRIAEVGTVDDGIRALAGAPSGDVGRGGMRSKVRTAEMAAAFGATTVVAHGRTPDVLARILAGEDEGTCFAAQDDPLGARKHWIAYTAQPRGTLVLDPGAVRAIQRGGCSLLPSGVTAVAGTFGAGEPVRCVDQRGREVARGLCNYAVDVLVRLCGLRSDAIRRQLGDDACEEAVHRDDLVLMTGAPAKEGEAE